MQNKYFLFSYCDFKCFKLSCFILVSTLIFSCTGNAATGSSASNLSSELVLKGIRNKPAWMTLWEKARISARHGDNQKASVIYKKLLMEKPQIEEALREYSLVLIELMQWDDAWSTLQKLLEIDSENLEYKFYAGRIALARKRYQRAATFMGQVYTMSPDASWSVEALRGQIVSLQKLGREDMAYPLLEQLYLLVPHEEKIIRRLAQDSLKLGHVRKAEFYYKTLLSEFDCTSRDYLEAEPLFEKSGAMEMAVRCWQGYLIFHPIYIPFHKKLSKYYLENGQEDKALPHLLVRIAHGEDTAQIFLQTGKLYLYQEGRPDKALYYYDEYRKRSLGDKKVLSEIKRIQTILANDLLVIVENEGAWTLWRDLAKVIPDRLAVYYLMADQLKSLGKDNELLEVLEIIHIHNPGDQDVLFKLAELYYKNNDFAASTSSLDSLTKERQEGRKYFFLRAEIEEKQERLPQALKYYRQYLATDRNDYPALLATMKLAAEIGHIHELHYFYTLLPTKNENYRVSKNGNLLYAKGLFRNKLYSKAENEYRRMLQAYTFSKEERSFIYQQIVKSLEFEKEYFKAEQQLRILFINEADNKKLVHLLIQTCLLEKNWKTAWKWYEVLVHGASDELWDHFIQKLIIYVESGKIDVGIAMAEDYLAGKESFCSENKKQCLELKTLLTKFYYREGEYAKAKDVLEAIIQYSPDDPSLLILKRLIQGRLVPSDGTLALLTEDDSSRRLALETSIYLGKLGEYKNALQIIKQYLEKRPDDFRGKVLYAQYLAASGDDATALISYKKLSDEFPGEQSFRKAIYELEFKMARFEDIIEELAPGWPMVKIDNSLLMGRKVPTKVDLLDRSSKIFLARTFWATKRWNDALLLYRSLLQPPVELVFSEKLKNEDISLVLPPPDRTFLNVMTFTTPAEPNRLSVVMDPEFTRENKTMPVATIAAHLYAFYRCQQMVNEELSVREAMSDGNYYQAMKEYQKLLNNDSSTESLFDLAGVYSRLGFSGKEAALYKILRDKSPDYPDLDEAIRRNSLKRRPRVVPFVSIDKKTGRDDYYDNRQQAGGLQAWFMPSLKHEFFLNMSRIYSESDKVEQDLWYNHLKAELTWSPVYDLDFLFGIGQNFGDGEIGNTFLYDLRVNGRIGDMVQGYLALSQDAVDDTVESLAQTISKQQYKAGVSLDVLPRLFVGSDYLFTEYSDGNHQNRYELWSSYILHSEPTLLKLRYGYEFSHNDDSKKNRDFSFASGFSPLDHPYWSPKEYWQSLFTIFFEHQLAGDVLGRGAPSYYSLEYSFGYEIGGYVNHEVKADIFLEMNRHFLLNSSLDYNHGSEQKNFNFLFSIIYRW